jgi:hypothetical protein
MLRMVNFALGAVVVAGALAASDGLVPRTWEGKKYGCKCYFGDKCWPKAKEWTELNATVDGMLHVHVPPEAACHTVFNGPLGTVSTYDAAICAEVTANYAGEQWT